MTKGILLQAWGKRGYGFAAFNLAVSLKRHSPVIPICLITDHGCMKHVLDHSVFDEIRYFDSEITDPGVFKAGTYDRLPFDYNLFVDVDSICLKDVTPLFDRLIKEGKPYRVHVYDYYNSDSPELLPMMVWGYKTSIWNHFNLSDHELPATQSSIQFIKKCPESKELFDLLKENIANPIPVSELREKWGGGQPDELYLNGTLAQLRIKPDIGKDAMFFGHKALSNPPSTGEVIQGYYFMSMFGGRNFIKETYRRLYDGLMMQYCKLRGHNHVFRIQHIEQDKHANNRTSVHSRTVRTPVNRSVRRQARIIAKRQRLGQIAPVLKPEGVAATTLPIKSKEKVTLLVNYYDTGNSARQRELNECLRNNISNQNIDKIIVLANCEVPFQDDKLDVVDYFERPTYQDFIELANTNVSGYTIIANSDIYFDDGISVIHQIDFNNRCLALSRHDVKNGKARLFDCFSGGKYGWSQDVWVFKGAIKSEGNDFYLGKPGCDNKFAYNLSEVGYKVDNPAKSIRCYHLHNVNIHSYTEDDRLPDPYLNVPATTIEGMIKKSLLLIQPGKVGDILICLPIAKFYADKGYNIYWQCPAQYHSLFNYVDYVTPVTNSGGLYDKTIDLSFGINTHSPIHKWWINSRHLYDSFVTAKYQLAEVDLSERHKLSYQRDTKKEKALLNHIISKHGKDYILFHGASDYGTPAERPEGNVVEFAPIADYSIFDWRGVIENAKEIHCIDSSLANFVEVIRPAVPCYFYRVPERTTESLFDFTFWKLALKLQVA